MPQEANQKQRAPLNRTLDLSEAELDLYEQKLLRLEQSATLEQVVNRTICGDAFRVLPLLPANSVDLLFADPPYNLSKTFGAASFRQTSSDEYEAWLDSWLEQTRRLLKPSASVYICADWRSSAAIQRVGSKYFRLQNRITWEREKGRGAARNWKSCAEDIWFFTVSENYTFNADAVRLKRRVVAPYRENGKPKDWDESDAGNFRLTAPSNIWTDISVPFWSMPENTDHPTQKPEKLLAKLILASTNENDFIFDPFLGVGTTSVTAKKLNRRYAGIEIDPHYACLTEKRLALAENNGIQGYSDGVFWDRNTFAQQKRVSVA